MYTLHNDFSISFHPDEDGKVDQVQRDYRNYNHPLLMLEATQWAAEWRHVPNEQTPILITGREVSAVMAALGVVGFTLAGYFAADLPGMILCSLATGLCPSLLIYAHYMKEDASLAGGIGVTVAGMAWVWNRRTAVGQLLGPMLAGAGAALAVSGKYVGAMAIAGALLAVVFAPWRRWYWWPIRVVLMAVFAVGVTAAINHRALEHWDKFLAGFNREYEHGTTEHSGVMLPRPSRFIYDVAVMETQPHVKVFAVALLLAIVTLRRGWTGDLISLVFTLICLATLSMGAIPFHRYGLPVVVLTHFLAGLGAARWVLQLAKRRALFWPALVLAIALFGWAQGARSADFNHQIVDDSRYRLREWARTHLRPYSRVIEDSYALLEDSDVKLALRGGGMSFAPHYGSLEDLRLNRNYTIVVCDSNYDRYLIPYTQGGPGEEDGFQSRREWYQQLFREGKLLWQSKAEHPTYSFTNPEIRVYSIKK